MSMFKTYDEFERELKFFYDTNEINYQRLEKELKSLAISILNLNEKASSLEEIVINELNFIYKITVEILHDNFILKSKINELRGELKDELTEYTNRKYYINILCKYLIQIINSLILNTEFPKTKFVFLPQIEKENIKNQTRLAHNFIESNISEKFYEKELNKQYKLGGLIYEKVVLFTNENEYFEIIKINLLPDNKTKNITPQDISFKTSKICYNVKNMTNENFIEFLKKDSDNIVLNINDNIQCYNRINLSEHIRAKIGYNKLNFFVGNDGQNYYKLYNDEVLNENDYLLLQNNFYCIYNLILSGKKIMHSNMYYNLYTVKPYTISEYLDPRILNASNENYGYCVKNKQSIKQHLLDSDNNIVFKMENVKDLICESRNAIKNSKENIEPNLYFIKINNVKIAVSKSSYKKIQNDKFSIYILHNTRMQVFDDVYQYEIIAYNVKEYFGF